MEDSMIYQGNLFDVLPTLARDSVDLVVTSPPYYNARHYGGDVLFRDPAEWLIWCMDVLIELRDVIKPSGVIWWNTGSGYANHRKMSEVYQLVSDLDMVGLGIIDEIPWLKTSGPPKFFKNRPPHMWEHNYIIAKNPDEVIFHRDNVRESYAEATLERMKYKVSNLQGDKEGEFTKRVKVEPNPKGKVPNNYLFLPQDTSARPHPAPMQPRLAEWAIGAYSEEGETVLDPMMGAGTTWIEAEKLGRNFIGIELYEEYVNLAQMSMDRLKRGENPYYGLKKEWEKRHG